MDSPILILCDKCGKLAPIDAEKSTDTWVVYKIDEPCTCGGHYKSEYKCSDDYNE